MKRIVDPSVATGKNVTGNNIRKAREKANLTQRELAIKLETIAVYICRGSLSRIENGSRIVTDIELKGLSEILHVPIEQFFEEEQPT